MTSPLHGSHWLLASSLKARVIVALLVLLVLWLAVAWALNDVA